MLRVHRELHYPERLKCAVELLNDVIAERGADRPCLRTDEETWSYGELLARANQVAHVLVEDLGLVPGQRVLLRAPNNPWLVACWFAVLKAGGVAVTTVPLLRTGELHQVAELTRSAVALCDARFAADLAPVPGLRSLTFGGAEPGALAHRAAGKPQTFPDVDTAADDVALLAATSGTTGVPKVTMHFHRDVLAIADTFGAHLVRGRPDDV